ncbi:hypothetical protein FNH22_07035 [Fulvivirga sp. M361]|uniref:STM3941 family protein n=1 Tax=Fulvivirga sp. M361 TaxID=2594266 RepID=UPI00117B98DD|nr:STM3941 family protein [Fulvivirga sp. M361]TRX60788.1 hypothetical protein FNH22_07035 [Fulvivirga sp. M361]
MKTIEIYNSNKKAILLFSIYTAFLMLSIFFIIHPEVFINPVFNSTVLVIGIGIISVPIFSYVVFVTTRHMIKKEVALIISSKGLHLNPKKWNDVIIDWESILGFRDTMIADRKVLIVAVTNPEYWLLREVSTLRKRILQFNLTNFGSPFNICAESLDIKKDDLKKFLNDSLLFY